MQTRRQTILGALIALALTLLAANTPAQTATPLTEWTNIKQAVAEFHGQPIDAALAGRPDKCGTPLVTEAQALSAELPALFRGATAFFPRPDLPLYYDSPEGKFRIHYAATGDSAVYNAGVDNLGPLNTPGADGIPDYVNAVADIFDSVWNNILGPTGAGNLGYPVPPDDSTYGSDTSALYDVFLPDVRGQYFGPTAPEDSAFLYYNGNFGWPRVSFIVLDNDYQEAIFSQVNNYQARPLDAVRVTAAHEFFHAVHFGIDGAEYPIFNGRAMFFWQEMTSVAMEEYLYDDINDYYGYLYSQGGVTAFKTPHRSLQTFNLFSFDEADFPYSMGVFVIYLTERFGPELVRGVWEGCGNNGPDALRALDSALIAISANDYNLNRAYNEFGTWLLFTGSRAQFAPPGVGFEEAAVYPMLSDTVQEHFAWPVTVTSNAQEPEPEVNSNSYIFFKNVFTTKGFLADCFKTLVSIPQFTTNRSVRPRLSLIGFPRSLLDDATIQSGPFTSTRLDTVFVVSENARDSLRQALLSEYGCWDIPGFFPDTSIFFNVISDTTDGADDTVLSIVKDVLPAHNLPAPTDFEFAVLQVTHTSNNFATYVDFDSVAQYPFAYIVRDTSGALSVESQPYVFFAPYPNPVTENDAKVTFGARRDLSTISTETLEIRVTILTEAGEAVRSDLPACNSCSIEELAVDWDFTNQSGASVVSGVYLALQQLINPAGDVVASEVAKIFIMR